MTTTDLRALLGDRYVETMRAAVLADNPDAITSASRVGGKLGQLMYLSAVDRLNRTLAAVLPDLLAGAWDEGYEAAVDANDDRLLQHDDTPNPYRTTATAAHCDRGPCHLPGGHGGPCNPGGDANTDERNER